ncbi:AAA family ATPase [Acetobacter sacchari]|uniref:AAA family ATPase n=1 Tax=Acetobacter sacchari TaxID=2661687 RepID=A0ABS3M0S1_9PROT|nr:AAA family ATPase [Acetobacter sacchari]MBO1361800.1 AAA family ATPase [Acetobacter sacchari]
MRPHESIRLTVCQQNAYNEIFGSLMSGNKTHALMGYAGTGKTTMINKLVLALREQNTDVLVTATTNKATAVIASKMPPGTNCQTIHAALGLKVKKDRGKTTLAPKNDRELPEAGTVVIIDECSMIGVDLMKAIRRDLFDCFVLFVGDPAQLPPVGEPVSPSFEVPRRSFLKTVVRQAVGNPIIEAATLLRDLHEGDVDLSWLHTQRNGNDGVFVLDPVKQRQWMDAAFTSEEFAKDPDAFRYLAFSNKCVDRINRRIRAKIYGETESPFIAGEKAVAGEMITSPRGEVTIANSEVVTVVDIQRGGRRFEFEKVSGSEAWTAGIPAWRVVLEGDQGKLTAWLPVEPFIVKRTLGRLESEAERLDHAMKARGQSSEEENTRWQAWKEISETFCDIKHAYAMTVHKSQGSTFRRAFVDLGDIMSAADHSGPLVVSQLLYVAATRASSALMMVNVPAAMRAEGAAA